MTLARSTLQVVSLIGLACLAVPQMSATAAEVQTNRILIEYVPPTNPAHQPLYDLLKQHRTLEKLQQVFSPFRLPIDLTLRAIGCNGISNARSVRISTSDLRSKYWMGPGCRMLRSRQVPEDNLQAGSRALH